MKNWIYILILLSFSLYPQWALWANPSLPVGSADNGIGLWAGQTMFSMNYNYQYIDWSHDQIPGEPFQHKGNLVTNIITPTITIGLSDYFNISYQQTIGVRSMDWMGDSTSMHHQDGNTSTDFENAHGSKFGDGTINLKYLITNTGMQSGSRIFLGAGLMIPSKNVLTVNPFLEN